ncbi:MAG: sugar ABC transporter substrate-binding protein [Lachnospiraceae bacterium]
MKRKSLAFVCAALASLATFSTACAKDTVTWWSWSTEATEALSSQATFAEENADISVDLQFAAAADYWVKLPVAIAAGTGPDVYQMTRPDFESYAASNQTMDLTDVISNSPLLQEYLNNLDPVLVDTYKFDGKQMAIPINVECSAIAYNKDITDAAGIDLKAIEDTWTWKDLEEIAKQLTVQDDSGNTTQYGFYVPADRMPVWEMIWSAGYEIFDESGKTCLLNEPGVVEALQPLADMYQAGISPSVEVTSTSSGDDMFMSGKIAMVTAGVWKISTYTNITSFNWDVVQLPLDPNTGKRRCSSNVIGLIINPNTKNLEAAIKLLEQVVQPECQKMYAETNATIPALESARAPFFDKDVPENITAYEKALSYVHPNVLSQYIPYQQFTQLQNETLKKGYSGQLSMADMLSELTTEINSIVAENEAKYN